MAKKAKSKNTSEDSDSIIDAIKGFLSSAFVEMISSGIKDLVEQGKVQLKQTEELIIQGLYMTLFMVLGIIFLVLSGIFLINEYAGISFGWIFMIFGLVMVIVGLIVKLNMKEH